MLDEIKKTSETLVKLLKNKKQKITFAESCTGGILASLVTDVSGSSEVFDGSFVTYANEQKIKILDVKEDTIRKYGVVSGEVAAQMAEGLYRLFEDECIAVSVTGIAGPTGGTPEKPVGTVFAGICVKGQVFTKQFNFDGDRQSVRYNTANSVFKQVIKYLEECCR